MSQPLRAKYQPQRAVAKSPLHPLVKLSAPTGVGILAVATAGALATVFPGQATPAIEVAPAADTVQIPTTVAEAQAVNAFTQATRKVALKETPTVVGTRYLKSDTNILMSPEQGSKVVAAGVGGEQVEISKNVRDGYREISYEHSSAWVLESMLLTSQPSKWEIKSFNPQTFNEVCSRGSGVESGLRPDTVHIYRSVCKIFPEVRSYGGVRADSLPYHPSGRALDIMLPGNERSEMGAAIAKYLIAHAREFNIDHIIFEQRLWLPGSGSWRGMSDRGGATANHYDHVHVSVR